MGKNRRLKRHLFLIPSAVILLALGITLLVFQVAFGRYMARTAAGYMEGIRSRLNLYYQDEGYEGFYDEEAEFIVRVYYAILDEKGKLVFPEEEWTADKEYASAKLMEKYWNQKSPGNPGKLRREGQTYYIQTEKYRGIYDGFFIRPEGAEETWQTYRVLTYVNISPIQSILDMANRILLGLAVVLGMTAIGVIIHMARRVDISFARLNTYIHRVGQREETGEPERLTYEEFNEVMNTVYGMSKEIERAEASQKQFFQNASHELRTPLMSLQGYAEGIRSGVIKDISGSADIIVRSSERMSALVDEILFLSRMESGSQELEWEVLEVKELVYQASWCLKERIDKKGLEICHAFPDVRLFICGDERSLERAITNILSNGLRYASSLIRITCEADENWVYIRIFDDGEGIDPKDLPYIFDRFYKGDKGNFGIGLAITEEVVARHGGEIRVASCPGNTEFEMVLPRHI